MARYYKDKFYRDNVVSIDEETKVIYVTGKMNAVSLHYHLSEIFDRFEWLDQSSPTMLITQQSLDGCRIDLCNDWEIVNPENVDGEVYTQKIRTKIDSSRNSVMVVT